MGAPEGEGAAFEGLRSWIGRNRNVLLCFGLLEIYVVTLPVLGILNGSIVFVFTLSVMGPNTLRSHVVNLVI